MKSLEGTSADHSEPAPQGDARDLWRVINELMADILLQVRPDGTIIFLNRAPNGLAPHTLLGRNIIDFVAPATRADVRQCLSDMAPGHPARRRLVQIDLPDGGRRWYATTLVPVTAHGGVVAATIAARDLSLQKHHTTPADPESKQLLVDVRHVQRFELIGLLAGGLVHNFNNVLSIIGSASALLLETLADADPRRADVVSIQRAIDHGTTVTHRLLALARRRPLVRTRVDLNSVVQDVVTLFRYFVRGNVRLITYLDPLDVAATVDRGEMQQVLLNLLLNARDALPDGGSIIISTSHLRYTAATAPPGCKLRGGVVRLRVEDSGTGMDDATRARVFEPFFTTKPAGQGTGLGLPTVEAIVKDSGGCVELASRPGVGTVVDVVLQDHDRAELCAA